MNLDGYCNEMMPSEETILDAIALLEDLIMVYEEGHEHAESYYLELCKTIDAYPSVYCDSDVQKLMKGIGSLRDFFLKRELLLLRRGGKILIQVLENDVLGLIGQGIEALKTEVSISESKPLYYLSVCSNGRCDPRYCSNTVVAFVGSKRYPDFLKLVFACESDCLENVFVEDGKRTCKLKKIAEGKTIER